MSRVDMEHVEYWRERVANEDDMPATREFDDDNLAILLAVISALEAERDAARNATLEEAAEVADCMHSAPLSLLREAGEEISANIRALMTQPVERMVPLAKVAECFDEAYVRHAPSDPEAVALNAFWNAIRKAVL